MKIKEIDLNLRPREKMIQHGAKSLTDVELLAIILASGTKNESVMDLAKRIINEYGFKNLLYLNYDELKKINGIKEAKATKLMAIFEIVRRVSKKLEDKIIIEDSFVLFKYIKNEYILKNVEVLTVIFLDKNRNIINKKTYSDDERSKVLIPKKKIVNDAINYKAMGIYLIHNHPDGNIHPSDDDINITYDLHKILYSLEILLLDHLIISNNNFYSFALESIYSYNDDKDHFKIVKSKK